MKAFDTEMAHDVARAFSHASTCEECGGALNKAIYGLLEHEAASRRVPR